MHIFVDETKSRGLLLTAAALKSADVVSARRMVRGLVLPGQRRIHFTKEQDSRRKQILDALIELAPSVVLYDGSAYPRHEQRRRCLEALMRDVAQQAELLVLEADESVLAVDEQVLYRQKVRLGCQDLRFQHLRAHAEPLLAIPDALAWCWQRGGSWRARARELVTEVRTI